MFMHFRIKMTSLYHCKIQAKQVNTFKLSAKLQYVNITAVSLLACKR